MGKVIAFSNQKGGSGKSTLSANLSVLWSNSGYKVAVIDADAQKSLSYCCLLYTSPSPRDLSTSRMPSSA